ncbi:protein transport protein [Vairimorpha apis BRL 01]|uniref:Protein transport protein n=1 Tax=Vairimorpha apis BRL 01 TaxID=1037528 RepID=T0MKT8_9MICR|nr:protein transport protein [Vairimorpha apis BRL 01]
MFGLFKMFYGFLLLANAVVILDDKRFLKFLGETRARIVDMINGMRVIMRIPLIIVNLLCIFYEIILG